MFNNKFTGFACVGLVLIGFNTTAKATDYSWNCSNSFWDITSCWSSSGSGLPTLADNIIANTSGYQLKIDAITGNAVANSLTLDNTATLLQSAGSLTTTTYQYIGYNDLGTYTQQGGANNANNLYLGFNSTATGNYNLSGASTTLNVSNGLYVGHSGTGILNINAGGVVSNTTGYLGFNSGANGTATISGSGSQWNNSSDLSVGESGTGTLNIDTGGVVSNTTGYLGSSSGANGTATVSGSESQWNNSSSLLVGFSGTGTLNIDSGGVVSNTVGYLGFNSGANGTATISGSGSLWHSSLSQYIGYSGTGTLNIDSGGVVSNGPYVNDGGYLGFNSGAIGTATISGSGSKWNNSDNLYVGNSGTGILNINTGGEVNNTIGYLGYYSGANGTATISGSGSWWNNSDLSVGRYGTGILNIDTGGVVSNSIGYLGYVSGANGTATISGSESWWNNSDDLFVGYYGTGILNIDTGGVVSNTIGHLGGYGSGANGTATISGSESWWYNSSDLFVGRYGTGILNIDTGGVVTNTIGYLGWGSGANGTATISDSGSQWNNSTSLVVGNSGTGILNIDTGGVVSNTIGYLGFNSGANGTATISGSGSQWNNSSDLIVGDSGTGILFIDSGGVVTNTTGYLGRSRSGAIGTATISGSGSKWNNSDDLYVGNSGTGILNINTGGVVSNAVGYLGFNSGANGTATINGSGSLWNISSYLLVGRSGTGILNIDTGGVVSSTRGYLGYNSGAANSIATINGSGSQWNNSSDLFVGYYGTGILNIDTSGVVSNTVGYLGFNSGANGTATISGSGSQWNNSSDLFVGRLGTGNLNINIGGAVSNTDGFLGIASGSSGTATISGSGSQWNNSGNLYVGGSNTSAGGNGEVTLANGGALTVAGNLQVWNTGTVNLNGGTINTQTLDGTGTFNFLAGHLNISADLLLDASNPLGNAVSLTGVKSLSVDGSTTLNGSNTLSLDGGVFSTGSLSNNGGFAFNSGTFNLTNDNLVIGAGGLFGHLVQFNAGQKVNVTNSTTVNAGSVLALNNSAFSSTVINNNGQIALQGFVASLGGDTLNNAGMLTGSGQVSTVLNNTTDGEIRANTGDELIFTGTGNANSNRISLLGGTVDFKQGLTNNANGLISGHGTVATGSTTSTGLDNLGSLAFSGDTDIIGDVRNAGKIIVSGGATATFHDDVIHNGSEIRVSANSQAVFFGSVSGAGNYTGLGSTFFEGDLLPGNSPALVNFEGDMTLGALSNTTMEIGGLLRGSQYDSFDVGSLLTLAGGLNIELYDLGSGLFPPNLGDTFDLFTAEVLQGEFDLISFVGLGNGLNWKLDYLTDFVNTTDYVRLSVVSSVPIPAGVWLFSTGLICVIGVGRCRKQ